MLTPYDEFPVHQYARPFSELPANDLNWDDGYYFGVYNADEGMFLYTGLRVTPNADIVGAYAGVSVRGVQTTVRASRVWRPDFSMEVGPISIEVLEPYEAIRLRLADNGSGLSFDLRWLGLAPPHEEAHHFAQHRARVTTDQTRYSQSGTASGWIEVDGDRLQVTPHAWYADRDHSWGLYEPRTPLSDPKEWLPPSAEPENPRMLRFWMPFQSQSLSGFYHLHEDEQGGQAELNDVFGTPFEGAIDLGGDQGRLRLLRGRHDLQFVPGTRVLAGGTLELEDEHGDAWRQRIEVPCQPWATFPIGYYRGTWKDGGNIHTYHGPPDPHVEWDVLDFSRQPTDHTNYVGRTFEGVQGAEYVVRVRTEGPQGRVDGLGHVEMFVHRRHQRYGSDARS